MSAASWISTGSLARETLRMAVDAGHADPHALRHDPEFAPLLNVEGVCEWLEAIEEARDTPGLSASEVTEVQSRP